MIQVANTPLLPKKCVKMYKEVRLLCVVEILFRQQLCLFTEQYGIMKPIQRQVYVSPCQSGKQ